MECLNVIQCFCQMSVYVRLRDACICRMNDHSTRFHSLLYMTACTGEIHMHWEDS